MSLAGATQSEPIDSDSDWETDEEQLVHVHLAGVFQDNDSKKFAPEEAKFIGLDTQEPLVQIGNQVFAGKYQQVLGTSVFFKRKSDEDLNDDQEDPVFDTLPKSELDYLAKTGKKLILKRVFIKEKPANSESETESK